MRRALWVIFCIIVNILTFFWALLNGGWWWVLFIVGLVIDIAAAVGASRNQKQASAGSYELARYRAEHGIQRGPAPLDQAAIAKNGQDTGTVYRFDEPKKAPAAPPTVDGKVIAYQYPDVELMNTTRAAVAFAKTGEPAELEVDGEIAHVSQGGRRIGDMKPTRLVGMVKDWQRKGDPVRAYVASYAWNGTKGVISLTFYRDELARIRGVKGSFEAKLNAVTDYADENTVGHVCEVEYDEDRKRYDVTLDTIRIGSLPASAVESIRALDKEPEDVEICVSRVDYGEEKTAVYVAIA